MILIGNTLDQLSQEQTAGLLTACGYAIREQSALSTALRELGFHVPSFNDQDCFLLEESADLIDDNDLAQLAVLCAQKLGIIADKQKKSTPKTLGYAARETWELFETGWSHADKFVKQRQEEANHKKDIKSCARSLEASLYDTASKGNTDDKVKALSYFRGDFRPQQTPETPLIGDHVRSIIAVGCDLLLLSFLTGFLALLLCYLYPSSKFSKQAIPTVENSVEYFFGSDK